MPFIPHSEADVSAMLKAIGVGVEIGQIDMQLMRRCCEEVLST